MAFIFQPVKSETISEEEPCLKVVNFERTPRMSTYLVAFIVGEYDFVEATDVDGIKVRVYTPLQRKEQGQFALQVDYLSSLSLCHRARSLLTN